MKARLPAVLKRLRRDGEALVRQVELVRAAPDPVASWPLRNVAYSIQRRLDQSRHQLHCWATELPEHRWAIALPVILATSALRDECKWARGRGQHLPFSPSQFLARHRGAIDLLARRV